MISGAAPAHAVFFGMYEFTKHRLGGNMAGHHPVEVAFAGACATVAMDGILTPMDAVKQRMQISPGTYSNVVDCIRKVKIEVLALFSHVEVLSIRFAQEMGLEACMLDTERLS